MFFMMGITDGRKDFDFHQQIICDICGKYGRLQVRALSRISLYSMRVPPYIFFCIDRVVVQTPVPSNAGIMSPVAASRS